LLFLELIIHELWVGVQNQLVVAIVDNAGVFFFVLFFLIYYVIREGLLDWGLLYYYLGNVHGLWNVV